jgi:hypothetical protein
MLDLKHIFPRNARVESSQISMGHVVVEKLHPQTKIIKETKVDPSTRGR